MSNILTIVKKELRRFFTDKRMLITLLLPGVMIYLLYSFMGSILMGETEFDYSYHYQVYVVNQPSELSFFETNSPVLIDITDATTVAPEEIFTDLTDKNIDLYIVFEANFYQNMMDYNASSGLAAPKVNLYYNSSNSNSNYIYNYYMNALNSYETSLTNKFDINLDPNQNFDLASSEDMSLQFITMLIPFLMITFLFSGSLAISTESIAGEKERGTIATLLATPTKRSEIALGKIIALSITAFASAISSFLGLILSLPKLIGEPSFTLSMYGIDTYLLLLIILITTVLIFVVLLSIISAYAKTIKEASSLAMPFMIVIMLTGISSMLGTAQLDSWFYLIPIYNSVQSLTAILGLNVSMLNLTVTILSNLAIVGLGIFILTKAFESEKVMFNK